MLFKGFMLNEWEVQLYEITPSFQATPSTILGYVFTKGIRPWLLNYHGT